MTGLAPFTPSGNSVNGYSILDDYPVHAPVKMASSNINGGPIFDTCCSFPTVGRKDLATTFGV